MSKYYFFLLIGLSAMGLNCTTHMDNSTANVTKSDSSVAKRFQAINMSFFIGKPVGLFLADQFIKSYKNLYFVNEPPGVLKLIELEFQEGVILQIRISDYQYLKKFSDTLQWSVEDLKKEKIAAIKLIIKDK